MSTDETRHLIDALCRQGERFTFFQAIRLMRRLAPDKIGRPQRAGDDTLGHIRIRPKLTLGFAPADLDRIERLFDQDQDRYQVTANFMGLYGTSSPLPTFYTEDLIDEKALDESVSRDFIDIIHQRLYELLFRCWQKHNQFFQVSEDAGGQHIERLFCVLGLGTERLRREFDAPERLLRYLGLLTQMPRSGAGLRTLLIDALQTKNIQLVAAVPRKAHIPSDQRMCLGRSSCRLGDNAYLGNEIDDRMGRFRIQIGPLAQEAFLRFTPGNDRYRQLTDLTDFYLNEPLEYEVELIMAAGQAQTTKLSDPLRAGLGVTTWVFSGQTLGQVKTRFAVARN